MWQRKLGLGLSDSFRLSVPEQLQAFARVGFDAFFSDDSDPEQRALPAEELARRGRECGLMYQSIHAPFKKAADLWQEDAAAGDAAVQELLDSLERRGGTLDTLVRNGRFELIACVPLTGD